MSIIHGRNIKIYAGASGSSPLIAAAKSCTVSMKADVIEKSSATQQTAKEYIGGRTDWEVSINHIVTSSAPFDGILKVNQTYTLRIDVGGTVKQGTAICVQADIQGAVGALGTGSVKFKGSGPLT